MSVPYTDRELMVLADTLEAEDAVLRQVIEETTRLKANFLSTKHVSTTHAVLGVVPPPLFSLADLNNWNTLLIGAAKRRSDIARELMNLPTFEKAPA